MLHIFHSYPCLLRARLSSMFPSSMVFTGNGGRKVASTLSRCQVVMYFFHIETNAKQISFLKKNPASRSNPHPKLGTRKDPSNGKTAGPLMTIRTLRVQIGVHKIMRLAPYRQHTQRLGEKSFTFQTVFVGDLCSLTWLKCFSCFVYTFVYQRSLF